MERQREERSLGELFAELSRETSTLVRQEVELAKTEMSRKVTRMGKHAGFIVAGGLLAYAALLAVVASLIALLAMTLELPVWVSALVVALVIGGVSYFLIQKGINGMKETDLTPKRTVQTLKEDVEWAKDQMK
jgi:hypothetical protein